MLSQAHLIVEAWLFASIALFVYCVLYYSCVVGILNARPRLMCACVPRMVVAWCCCWRVYHHIARFKECSERS